MTTPTAVDRPRPRLNETLPCPSDSARRRHLAHGRICPICHPQETR